ncbi:hypothetical protein [Streptomyces tendae]|uniref:hypothetical protein n=1 Tax=Streptomyces tendae TaxID=1932 RepID=UPI00132FCA27|nr:hypothetical protein [Streptomyces tendae]
MPSSTDRTASGTEFPPTRLYPWLRDVTTLAILITILVLALTRNEVAATTLAAAVGGAQLTVHTHR